MLHEVQPSPSSFRMKVPHHYFWHQTLQEYFKETSEECKNETKSNLQLKKKKKVRDATLVLFM